MIRDKLKKLNETLLDLLIGIVLFDVLVGFLGILITKRNLYLLLGTIVGTIEAISFSFMMLYFIDGALDMDAKGARAYMLKGSLLRYGIMAVTGVVTIRIENLCFIGFVLALMGIKVAAYLQPFINLYITKKHVSD